MSSARWPADIPRVLRAVPYVFHQAFPNIPKPLKLQHLSFGVCRTVRICSWQLHWSSVGRLTYRILNSFFSQIHMKLKNYCTQFAMISDISSISGDPSSSVGLGTAPRGPLLPAEANPLCCGEQRHRSTPANAKSLNLQFDLWSRLQHLVYSVWISTVCMLTYI